MKILKLLGIQLKKVLKKVGCAFPVVIDSILPYAEFVPNDHREDAPHFINESLPVIVDPGEIFT